MWRGPQEYITYKLVPTSPAVSLMSGLYNFDSFREIEVVIWNHEIIRIRQEYIKPFFGYADDIAILANTPNQAETLLYSMERVAAGIGLHVNAHKTEYMCYNQKGDITTRDGTPQKLVDKFTYLGSSVSSTEKDIDTRLTKSWRAINRLSIIWKSDLTDKMKRSFFQAAVVSILLYGCTTWTLTKRLEKKLDGNYTRMLRAILNKSWRQHPTRHQLYGHLPPITKTIQVRRTRHVGHCWRSRDELMYSYGPPHMARQKQDDQLEHTFSSYVRIRDVALKTCQRQ